MSSGDRNWRPEPEPSSDEERAAVARVCPACFAHAGEWCATSASRGQYLPKMHAARFIGPVGGAE